MVIAASFDERTNQFYSTGFLSGIRPGGYLSEESITVSIIWDTGAPKSLISERFIRILDPWILCENDIVSGIGGARHSLDCAALLEILDIEGNDVWRRKALWGTFPGEEMSGVDVIIGIDIILDGRFVIEKQDGHPALFFTVNDW